MAETLNYKVEKKEEFRRLTKAGEVETWYRIWATSKGGTYYHIELAESELPKAGELLAKRAKELDTI